MVLEVVLEVILFQQGFYSGKMLLSHNILESFRYRQGLSADSVTTGMYIDLHQQATSICVGVTGFIQLYGRTVEFHIRSISKLIPRADSTSVGNKKPCEAVQSSRRAFRASLSILVGDLPAHELPDGDFAPKS